MTSLEAIPQLSVHLDRFAEEFGKQFTIDFYGFGGLQEQTKKYWTSQRLSVELPNTLEGFQTLVVDWVKHICVTNKLRETDACQWSNDYWSQQLPEADSLCERFQALLVKDREKIVNEVKSLEVIPKGRKRAAVVDEKKNQCKAVYKSGANKGKECGKPCVGEFCGVHMPKEMKEESAAAKKPRAIKVEAAEVEEEPSLRASIPSASEVEKKTRKMKKKLPSKYQENLQKLIAARVKAVHFNKNMFGRYENTDTGFVYDPAQKKVVGKQMPDGSLAPLTINDIEHCKDLMIDFEIPSKLGDVVEVKSIEHDDDYEELSDEDEEC